MIPVNALGALFLATCLLSSAPTNMPFFEVNVGCEPSKQQRVREESALVELFKCKESDDGVWGQSDSVRHEASVKGKRALVLQGLEQTEVRSMMKTTPTLSGAFHTKKASNQQLGAIPESCSRSSFCKIPSQHSLLAT